MFVVVIHSWSTSIVLVRRCDPFGHVQNISKHKQAPIKAINYTYNTRQRQQVFIESYYIANKVYVTMPQAGFDRLVADDNHY